MADEVEAERRVSSEVISIAQRMKQDGNVQKVAEKAAAEIEAEFVDKPVALLRPAGDADDPRAGHLGELAGHGAHGAGRSVDDDRLARLRLAFIENSEIGGEA